MTKKITSLTKEQEAKIPDFIAKWVNMASTPTDKRKATKAVQDIYAKMGEEKPIIIFGESPFSTAVMAAITFTLVDPKNKEKLVSQLDSQLGRHLDSQLVSQLRRQLGSQLRSQLVSQLVSQLDSQLVSQLGSQLVSQLGSQLVSQLRSQLDSQLRRQLGSQLVSQLRRQLGSQLRSQLRSQLVSQLDSQLVSQLRSQLVSQLGSQLRSQLDSQLGSQLVSQLRSQLDSQLGSQLRSQLKNINQDWYNSIWWLAWSGWYDYGQYIGVEFDKATYDLFMAFVSNVGFIIPYEGIAFISEAPTKIIWDESKRLSYDHGKAVKYKDGWGLYCLDGVTFTEEEWTKITTENFTLEEIGKANMGADKSAIAQKYLRPDRLLEACKAKLVHTGIKGTKLFQVDNFMNTGKTQYCMLMKHPSIDRQYIEWVHPDIGKKRDADLAQCAAWRDKDGDPIPLEDYLAAIEA